MALEGLCYDFSTRTELEVIYRGLELPELSTTVALSIYRLVQEALTNIAKHAAASRVAVTVTREEEQLRVEVADNGQGFVPDVDTERPRRRSGIGLVSMRERAELLGGTLEIDTSPGQGTRLTARIPLWQEENGEEQ